jgi:hypothetical protein
VLEVCVVMWTLYRFVQGRLAGLDRAFHGCRAKKLPSRTCGLENHWL